MFEDGFWHNEVWFEELYQLIEEHFEEIENDNVRSLPDDFTIECYLSKTEKIVDFNIDFIIDKIEDLKRFPEDDCYSEFDTVAALLEKYINFEAINKEMPECHYQQEEKIIFTKQDIINSF